MNDPRTISSPIHRGSRFQRSFQRRPLSTRPDWLSLNVAAGDVTLNQNTTVNGSIVTPSGAITINSGSTLYGSGVLNDPR